jgi:two-component system cell cycle sensor histidine kinase PleC
MAYGALGWGAAAKQASPELPPESYFDAACEEERQQLAAAEASEHELRLKQAVHELRTALNAVLGFSEVMMHQMHGPLGHPKYTEYVRHVHQAGSSVLAISADVLSLVGKRR